MSLNQIIGSIIVFIGIIFQIFGIIGVFKHKNFYTRLTITSLIDSSGFITIMIGFIIYSGFSFTSFKLALIIALTLLLNPLSNHVIGRGAHGSHYCPPNSEKGGQ